MDPNEESVFCENCNTRFTQRLTKKRKRYMHGKETLLLKINNFRRLKGLPPLGIENVICHGCFRRFEYAGSSQSSSFDEEPMETSDTEENITEQEIIPATTFVPPAIAGSSSSAVPVIGQESCCLCNTIFTPLNPKNRRYLRTVELFRMLLNGDRANSRQPTLEGDQLVCDECFWPKMEYFSEGWRILNLQIYPQVGLPEIHPIQPVQIGNQPEHDQEEIENLDSDDSMDHSETGSSEEDISDEETSEGNASADEDASENDGDAPEPEVENINPAGQPLVLPIPRIAVSGTHCCICGRPNTRTRIKKEIRSAVWVKFGIYISNQNRCCTSEHIDPNGECGLNNTAIQMLKSQHVFDETNFTRASLLEFISSITERSRELVNQVGRISFRNEFSYNDFEYNVLLSVSHEQFNYLHSICRQHLRPRVLSTRDTLATFLMKMRLNMSLRSIGVLFNVTEGSISRAIKKVRMILVKEFVPSWLGYGHIGRQEYIQNHTTVIAKTITGATDQQAISVIDGTYLYTQKSRNYLLQRRTFSPHKYRNLMKVMVTCSTTGYILDIEGPYFGDGANNDASIMRSMCRDANGFRSFHMPGDFIIEDRGFRDSNTLLTHLGYSVKMPHFLGRRSQHPTSEANESRLVTKIRWVVESVNGRIKSVFRLFRDTLPNTYIKKNRAFEFLQIACAMLNAFHPPLATDKEGDKRLAEEMLVRSTMHNLFMEHLISENYIRSTGQWRLLLDSDLQDFPRLTRDELREFTFGVYQIKEARSYISDSCDETGSYDIYFHPILGKNIIRFKIQSRHHSSIMHFVWIGYQTVRAGTKNITGWYCKCPNGSRMVGCCAHIAAVLWYLCYARYLGRIVPPGTDLATLVRDAPTYRYEEEFLDVPTREEERRRAEHVLRANNEEGNIESESNDESDNSTGSWLL